MTKKQYKRYRCLKCGNIFPSFATYRILCVNGVKKGCGSTLIELLEEPEQPKQKVQEEKKEDFFLF
jgi:DNA-directed RNA polymerase subunit RPC12/RpoP